MINALARVEANTMGQDYVCGDLHGQHQLLIEALKRVNFNMATDRLFSLGDLVDRGAKSREVFSLVEEPWFYPIRGNHEQLMFDALENQYPQDVELWMQNGGGDWVNSINGFTQDPLLMALVKQQRETMPWAIELALTDGRKLGLVHAETVIPDWQLFTTKICEPGVQASQLRYQSIWSRQIREEGYELPVEGVDLCVHGHCMFMEPVRQFNRCYIDTGACLTRKTMFGLKQKRLGYLSLLPVEKLFDIPSLELAQIRQLSWHRQRLK